VRLSEAAPVIKASSLFLKALRRWLEIRKKSSYRGSDLDIYSEDSLQKEHCGGELAGLSMTPSPVFAERGVLDSSEPSIGKAGAGRLYPCSFCGLSEPRFTNCPKYFSMKLLTIYRDFVFYF
jgi:hypothetical protein